MLYELMSKGLSKYRLGGKVEGLQEVVALKAGNVPLSYVTPVIYNEGFNLSIVANEVQYQFSSSKKLAVRSSGASEDSTHASFAGQYESVLNVDRNNKFEVRDAIQMCLDSREGAEEYAKEMGIDLSEDDFCLLFQPMMEFKCSGIAFLGDPKTRDASSYVIEAVSGTCEKLAAGEQNPELSLRGSISPDLLEPFIRLYDIENTWNDPDGNLMNLARKRLNDAYYRFRRPIDVEWGIDFSGTFYFIQVRPITKVEWITPGMTIGTGVVRGVVRKVGISQRRSFRVEADAFQSGEILVTTMTTPRMVGCMVKAGAIVTEIGGETCHAAIVARELGKPAIVGYPGITNLKDGTMVEVDADAGIVRVVDE